MGYGVRVNLVLWLLHILQLQYHLCYGLAVLQSTPFNTFRFECPSKHGIQQIDVRTIDDRTRTEHGIMYTVICSKLQDIYPIDQRINAMEKEECSWSDGSDTKFNRTCLPSEYLAGMARMSDTSYATLCCKLRTREYHKCENVIFGPSSSEFENLMEFKNGLSMVTSYAELEGGHFEVSFCNFKMREEELIVKEHEKSLSINHSGIRNEIEAEADVSLISTPLDTDSRSKENSLANALRDFPDFENRLELPRHTDKLRSGEHRSSAPFDLESWPSLNGKRVPRLQTVGEHRPNRRLSQDRFRDQPNNSDRKRNGRNRPRPNGFQNTVNGRNRAAQVDRRQQQQRQQQQRQQQRQQRGRPTTNRQPRRNLNQRTEALRPRTAPYDPRFPLIPPRVPVQVSVGDARPPPIRTIWFPRSLQPIGTPNVHAVTSTAAPIRFAPAPHFKPNLEFESSELVGDPLLEQVDRLLLSSAAIDIADVPLQADSLQSIQAVHQIPPQTQQLIPETQTLNNNDFDAVENRKVEEVFLEKESGTDEKQSDYDYDDNTFHIDIETRDPINEVLDRRQHLRNQPDHQPNLNDRSENRPVSVERNAAAAPREHLDQGNSILENPEQQEQEKSTSKPNKKSVVVIDQDSRTFQIDLWEEVPEPTVRPHPQQQLTTVPQPPSTRPPPLTFDAREPGVFAPPVFLNSEEIREHVKPPATPNFRPPPPVHVAVEPIVINENDNVVQSFSSLQSIQAVHQVPPQTQQIIPESQTPNNNNLDVVETQRVEEEPVKDKATDRQGQHSFQRSSQQQTSPELSNHDGRLTDNRNTPVQVPIFRGGRVILSSKNNQLSREKSVKDKSGLKHRLSAKSGERKLPPVVPASVQPEVRTIWEDHEVVLQPLSTSTFIPRTQQLNKIERRKFDAFKRLARRFPSSEFEYVYEENDAAAANLFSRDGERRQRDFEGDVSSTGKKVVSHAPLLPRGGFQRLFVHNDIDINNDKPINQFINNNKPTEQFIESNSRTPVRFSAPQPSKPLDNFGGGSGIYVFHLGDGQGYKKWSNSKELTNRSFKEDLRRCVVFGTC